MSKLDQLRALREADAKSSRGGGEKQTRSVMERIEQTAQAGAIRKCSSEVMNSAAAGRNAQAGVASGPREAVSRQSPGHHNPMAHLKAGRETTATEASPTMRAAAPKKGRPLAKDRDRTFAATKPWEAEGVSERTWYRRRAEKT